MTQACLQVRKDSKMAGGVEVITKRMAISKSKAQLVIIVGAATFVTIFCLISAKNVFSNDTYQSKVIDAQKAANAQLETNLEAYSTLSQNYKTFLANTTNILGGQSSSTADNGGNDTKVILDALPPSYDFPALASSIEAILSNQGLNVTGIGGTDNELTEQSNNSSANPQPVEMPFTFALESMNYAEIGSLFDNLQKSVRPIAVDSISLSGGGSNITMTVQAHTYYQPAVSYGVTQQVVK
jgi:hypothetical protein